MSRGFGTMQRWILEALTRMQPCVAQWAAPPEWQGPADPAAPLVDVWSVCALQTGVALLHGDWCEGTKHPRWRGARRQRTVPRQSWLPHAPHSTWRHTEYVSFSRALHRLVATGVLGAVHLQARPAGMPTIYLSRAPRWGIDYVVKC
jgi:hypothetical protein